MNSMNAGSHPTQVGDFKFLKSRADQRYDPEDTQFNVWSGYKLQYDKAGKATIR